MRTLITFSEMLSFIETQLGNRTPRAVIATMLATAVEQIGLTQLPKSDAILYKVQENQLFVPYPDNAVLIKTVGKAQYVNSEIVNIVNLPENNNINLPVDPLCLIETPTGTTEQTGDLYCPFNGSWIPLKPFHLNKDWAYRFGSWLDDKMDRRIVLSDKIKEGDMLYLMFDSAESKATLFPRELQMIYVNYTYYLLFMVQDPQKAQNYLRTYYQLIDDYKMKNMPSVLSIASVIDRNRSFGV
jgi:hypothetical protein